MLTKISEPANLVGALLALGFTPNFDGASSHHPDGVYFTVREQRIQLVVVGRCEAPIVYADKLNHLTDESGWAVADVFRLPAKDEKLKQIILNRGFTSIILTRPSDG